MDQNGESTEKDWDDGYDDFDDFNTTLMESATAIGLGSPTGVEGEPVFYGGVVYTWGSAFNGELGHSQYTAKGICPVPRRIPDLCGVIQVGCGEGYTAALRSDGAVFTWGQGYKLGHGAEQDCFEPRRVEGLGNMFIKKIACGQYHMAAIEECYGGMYAWGKGSYGCLGTGSDKTELAPVKVVTKVHMSGRTEGHLDGAHDVACGYCTTAAIVGPDRELMVWGAGDHGRLALGDYKGRAWVPITVEGLRNVTQVSLGSWHGGCCTEEGHLYTWGRGEWGNLGNGKRVRVQASAQRVLGGLEGLMVRQVACSTGNINPITGPGKDGLHTLVVTEQGQVFTFGTGNKGRLANLWGKWSMHLNGKEDALLPYQVGGPVQDEAAAANREPKLSKYLDGEPMVQVCPGNVHSTALSAGGRLYGWGDGTNGRLGLRRYVTGNKTCKFYVSAPELIEELWDSGVHVKQVCTSRQHMCAIAL